MLWHYDAEYDSISRSRKLQGMVTWKTFCIYVRNRHGNLNVPYLYENGDKVVLNWNWLDNDWNSNNPALRHAIRIISLLFLRESFAL